MPDGLILEAMAEAQARSKELVEKEPGQESLIEPVQARVVRVDPIQVPYMSTHTEPFTMSTVIGPGGGSGSHRYRTTFPGLLIEVTGAGPIKRITYVPDGIASPVRGGDTIAAKVVAERYAELDPHYMPERSGPPCGWSDLQIITHVRERSPLVEAMQAIEIAILNDAGHEIRVDKGLFPQNPHEKGMH